MYILLIFIYIHFIYYLHEGHILRQEGNYENISAIEDDLQTHFKDLSLGTGKLWRHIAKGGYSPEQKNNKENVFKVFVTMIPKTKFFEYKLRVNL